MFKKTLSILLISLFSIGIASNAYAARSGKSSSSSKSTERPNQHGGQGTGNWKGKRDKHEKPGPQNEKKKQKDGWFNLK